VRRPRKPGRQQLAVSSQPVCGHHRIVRPRVKQGNPEASVFEIEYRNVVRVLGKPVQFSLVLHVFVLIR
jgi:hypothetical protein